MPGFGTEPAQLERFASTFTLEMAEPFLPSKLVAEVVQLHADAQVGLVHGGADVDIALPVIGAQQIERELDEALFIITGLHGKHARRM